MKKYRCRDLAFKKADIFTLREVILNVLLSDSESKSNNEAEQISNLQLGEELCFDHGNIKVKRIE